MEDEATEAEQKRKSRMRLIAVMMLLIVLGIALYATPIFLYPDNVIYEGTLSEANGHTTNAQLTIEKGTYEVWMTTSLWSWFYLDMPLVHVNSTTDGPIHIDTVLRGDDRTIQGDECRHFTTFIIDEKATYNVTVIAGLMALGIPGTERVYIVEERPAAYAPMQWAGILMILVGILGIILLMLMAALVSSEERKKERIRQSPPPGTYPPPGYAPYPPQQAPPPYSQYPPPQQQPPYPPPGQQQPPYPPPGQQQPPYPPPGQQQPPPGQGRRGPPPY
jgi:flagellar basal body-associated protein FliL